MNIRDFIDTSVLMLILRKKLESGDILFEQCASRTSRTYRDSRIFKIINSFLGGLKVSLKYSFPARAVWINWDRAAAVFENSVCIRRLLNIREGLVYGYGLNVSPKSSALEKSLKEIKGQLCLSPLKNGAMIIIIAILTEAGLWLIFKKPIGLFGWLIRGLFLFAGLWGLNVSAGREEAIKSSLFLKNYK